MDMDDLHVGECAMRRDESPAAQHKVAVLDDVRPQAATRLVSGHADGHDVVDPLERRFSLAAHRDDRAPATGSAERAQFALHSGVGGIVTVDEMQNFDRCAPHGAES